VQIGVLELEQILLHRMEVHSGERELRPVRLRELRGRRRGRRRGCHVQGRAAGVRDHEDRTARRATGFQSIWFILFFPKKIRNSPMNFYMHSLELQ